MDIDHRCSCWLQCRAKSIYDERAEKGGYGAAAAILEGPLAPLSIDNSVLLAEGGGPCKDT